MFHFTFHGRRQCCDSDITLNPKSVHTNKARKCKQIEIHLWSFCRIAFLPRKDICMKRNMIITPYADNGGGVKFTRVFHPLVAGEIESLNIYLDDHPSEYY